MKKRYVHVTVELTFRKNDIVTASGDNIIEDFWYE